MRRNFRAFTLVELMVAMSIVAVLIGLSAFGITTAQRNLRDNQRRDKIKDVAAGLANYYTYNSSYPSASTFTALLNDLQVPVQGVTTPTSTSTPNGTRYCYAIVNDGYVLGALLEGATAPNNWFNLGSGTARCQDNASYQLNS